ncbi:MAG TPA: TIGR01777 family oxidoreductase, partial [Candidatus Angelobacter sp.]
IGQELCRALLADGHELTLLARDPLKTSYLFGGRVQCVTQIDDLAPGTRFDVVINLAGERILGPRWTSARRRKLVDSRVGTTRSLVAWIARATCKPRLMISASAVGYYGAQEPGDLTALAETGASRRAFVSEICHHWEDAARTVTHHHVPLVVLRLGMVLGHQGALPLMRLPFLAGMGGRLGNGRQVISWIHIQDVLDAIAHIMANPNPRSVEGVYNLTAPQPVTQFEFARTLARVLHRPSLLPMPAAVLRLILGEQAMILLEGQRVCPARLEKDRFRFHFPQLEPALRDLC